MSKTISIESCPDVLGHCILPNLDPTDLATCKRVSKLFLRAITNNPSLTRRYQQQSALACAKKEVPQVPKPRHNKIYGLIGEAAASAGMLKEAKETITQITPGGPTTNIHSAIARYQTQKGPVSAAHETAKLPSNVLGQSEVRFEILKELLSLGRTPEAQETLKGIEHPFYLRRSYCEFASFHVKQGTVAKASEMLRQADDFADPTDVTLAPAHKDTLLHEIGHIHGSLGNLEAAKACFNRMQITRERPAYRNQEEIVRIHAEAGRITEAEEVLSAMAQKVNGTCSIIAAHVRAGNFDQAKQMAKKLHSVDMPKAHRIIAKGEAAAGRFEEAKKTVEYDMPRVDTLIETYPQIAEAQGAKGLFSEAEKTVQEMLAKNLHGRAVGVLFTLVKMATEQKNGGAERSLMKLAQAALMKIESPEEKSTAYLALISTD